MVATDTMLMADGAAVVGDGSASRLLELAPARQGLAVAAAGAEHVGGVDARTLAVDVRQVGEHVHALALLAQAVAQAVFNFVQQIVDVTPVGGSFQGVHCVTGRPQAMAQVGKTKAVLRPLLAQQGTGEHPAEALEQALGLFHRERVLRAVAGDAEGQHALAGAGAAQGQVFFQPGDLPGVAGQGQLGLGLDGVGQAQHRQRHARLHQGADAGQSLLPAGQEHGKELLLLGQPGDPYLDLGDHPEAPFRTEDQLAQIRAGGRGRKGRDLQGAGESLDLAAGKQLLDAPIAQRLLTAGTAGHPATEGRQLPGLREVAEGVAARAQLGLHLRAIGAGGEGGDQAALVEIEQLGHALQRQGQYRLLGLNWVDMPGHRGAAAVGDDDHILLTGPGQQLADLRGGFRQGHAIGKHAEITGAHGQPVRQALSARMAHAHLGIQTDQRMASRQARRRHLSQHLRQAGVGQRLTCADPRFKESTAIGWQLHLRGLVTPSVPTSHLPLPCVFR